jgi:hypothetical protein
VTSEVRESAERILVEAAQSADATAVARLGRELRARLDQDGHPPTDTELLRPPNELRWVTRPNGDLVFKGRLAAEDAAWMTTVVSPLAKPRPAADGVPDPRTTAERQGDALAQALRLAASCGDLPDEGGERPTVVVTVTLESLRDDRAPALFDGAGLVDARAARRIACDSSVIPAVLGANSEPLDIGRKTRVIPTALRRALILRDRACAFPGCGAPPRWCDAHHIRSWATGGPTSLPNLVLLCGYHHRMVHHSEWEVRAGPDSRPEFVPPAYIDPTRKPRTTPVLVPT